MYVIAYTTLAGGEAFPHRRCRDARRRCTEYLLGYAFLRSASTRVYANMSGGNDDGLGSGGKGRILSLSRV